MLRNKIKLALVIHKDKFKTAIEIVRSIADYAMTNSVFSLIGGGLLGVEKLLGLGSNDPTNFFCPANDWVPLTEHAAVHNVFLSTLLRLEGIRIPFEYDNVKMFKTPHGDFVVVYDRYSTNESVMLAKSIEREAIMMFLGDEKLKELNSKSLSLDEITVENQTPNLLLSKFNLKPVSSPKADELISEIDKYFKKDINRSLMLHGLPGVGKSTLAHTIVDHFGFRTLKIHPNDSIKLPYFVELIKLLKIEALILDDFDQIEMNDKILEFLEVVNMDLKLTIGIANMLDGFDPAVLRPGRFDDIKKIEEIEESTLVELLGELTEEYFDKVRAWPIAYIKELIKQHDVNLDNLQIKYEELDNRVKKLRESYSKRKEFTEEVEDARGE